MRVQMRASHLDAVQGRAEQRNELYRKILRMSSGGSDAVMRQKSKQRGQLGWLAGLDDAKFSLNPYRFED